MSTSFLHNTTTPTKAYYFVFTCNGAIRVYAESAADAMRQVPNALGADLIS